MLEGIHLYMPHCDAIGAVWGNLPVHLELRVAGSIHFFTTYLVGSYSGSIHSSPLGWSARILHRSKASILWVTKQQRTHHILVGWLV